MHLARSKSLHASFWRGGTSKGVFIPRSSLPFAWDGSPEARANLQKVLNSVMGSPDKYGRQLNGMGGGISSLSKAVIYWPAPKEDQEADVEYLFAQIGIKDGKLDLSGNCGNLTSAIGPIALNEGMAKNMVSINTGSEDMQVKIRLRNVNTSKIIHSLLTARYDSTHDTPAWKWQPVGTHSIDGVSGTSSKILLQFTSPGGAKTGKTLPTESAVDAIQTAFDTVKASLVDVTNPGIFVDGRDLCWSPATSPDDLNAQTELMRRLELIRRRGTEMMGLDPNDSAVPKIVLVYPPATDDVHITCQALSMEMAHKAVPGTLALNLAAACKLPGTIPNTLARPSTRPTVLIGHPSGKAEVGANVKLGANAKDGVVESVELSRTARCLMEGYVNYKDG